MKRYFVFLFFFQLLLILGYSLLGPLGRVSFVALYLEPEKVRPQWEFSFTSRSSTKPSSQLKSFEKRGLPKRGLPGNQPSNAPVVRDLEVSLGTTGSLGEPSNASIEKGPVEKKERPVEEREELVEEREGPVEEREEPVEERKELVEEREELVEEREELVEERKGIVEERKGIVEEREEPVEEKEEPVEEKRGLEESSNTSTVQGSFKKGEGAIDESLAQLLRSFEGRFFWAVDLKKTADQVAGFYPGARVQVLRRLPGRLLVFVQEPENAFLLLKEGEGFYLVSQKGEIGPLIKQGELLDLPILRGSALASLKDLRQRAFSMFESFPQEGAFLSKEHVSEIFYRPSRQAFLFYVSGFTLELKGPLSQKAIRRMEFVLNYLLQKGRHRAFVDARQLDKIIVKNSGQEPAGDTL